MKLIRQLQLIYNKYKSIVLYIFFGGCTTLISLLVFYLVDYVFKANEHIANLCSWILAVLFAFVTNRKWVFDGKVNNAKQFIKQILSFYAGRLTTFFIEELMIFGLVTLAGFNGMYIKIIAQFVVLVLNFIISKFFVFKRK